MINHTHRVPDEPGQQYPGTWYCDCGRDGIEWGPSCPECGAVESVRAWLKSHIGPGHAVTQGDIRRRLGLAPGRLGRMLKDPEDGKTAQESGTQPLGPKMAMKIAVLAGLDTDECARRWWADAVGLHPDDVEFRMR